MPGYEPPQLRPRQRPQDREQKGKRKPSPLVDPNWLTIRSGRCAELLHKAEKRSHLFRLTKKMRPNEIFLSREDRLLRSVARREAALRQQLGSEVEQLRAELRAERDAREREARDARDREDAEQLRQDAEREGRERAAAERQERLRAELRAEREARKREALERQAQLQDHNVEPEEDEEEVQEEAEEEVAEEEPPIAAVGRGSRASAAKFPKRAAKAKATAITEATRAAPKPKGRQRGKRTYNVAADAAADAHWQDSPDEAPPAPAPASRASSAASHASHASHVPSPADARDLRALMGGASPVIEFVGAPVGKGAKVPTGLWSWPTTIPARPVTRSSARARST